MSLEKLTDIYEVYCIKYLEKVFKTLLSDLNVKDTNILKAVDYMMKEGDVLNTYKNKMLATFSEEEINDIYVFHSNLKGKMSEVENAMEIEMKRNFNKIDEDTIGRIVMGDE